MSAFLQKHYRSIILLCCFLVLFANMGLTATSFNVYQTYLVELPGVGALGGSFILTVRAFVSLVVMLFVAKFYERVNPRIGVVAATLCTAAGFAVYGFFPTLWGLVAGSVLTGIGYGLGGMVATTVILGRWFNGSLGTAAGFVGMGSGVASFVIPTIAADVVERAGLSIAFFSEAALALLLAMAFALFLRADPHEVGLEPYKGKPRKMRHMSETTGPPSADSSPAPSMASASTLISADNPLPKRASEAHCVRKPCNNLGKGKLPRAQKRFMMLAMLLMGGVAITGFSYFSVLLTSSGVNLIAAAVITSIGGACLAVGKLACGWTFDRVGTRTGTIVFFAFLLVGLMLCVVAGDGGASEGFFAAVTYCTGISVATTGIAVWSLELSSPESRMKTVRDFNLAYAAGGFVFNMMPGVLIDLTGTYATTYAVLAVFALVSAIIVIAVYTKRTRS